MFRVCENTNLKGKNDEFGDMEVVHCHHRLSAVSARRTNHRPSRSDHPFGLQVPKCLDRQTDRQKHKHTNFIHDPPEEIFGHNTFSAKALKPLVSTILNYVPLIFHANDV